jgi:hypothetical protein
MTLSSLPEGDQSPVSSSICVLTGTDDLSSSKSRHILPASSLLHPGSLSLTSCPTSLLTPHCTFPAASTHLVSPTCACCDLWFSFWIASSNHVSLTVNKKLNPPRKARTNHTTSRRSHYTCVARSCTSPTSTTSKLRLCPPSSTKPLRQHRPEHDGSSSSPGPRRRRIFNGRWR